MGKLSFEKSLERLDIISEELGSGKIELDEALELYTEASTLINACNKKISTTKLKLGKLMDVNEEIKDNDE